MIAVIIFIQNRPELIGCQCKLPSAPDLFKLHSIVMEVQHLDKWTNTDSCMCIIPFEPRMLKKIWKYLHFTWLDAIIFMLNSRHKWFVVWRRTWTTCGWSQMKTNFTACHWNVSHQAVHPTLFLWGNDIPHLRSPQQAVPVVPARGRRELPAPSSVSSICKHVRGRLLCALCDTHLFSWFE